MSRANTEKYGELYWCVKSSLSDSGEIYFHADRIGVNENGDMIAWAERPGAFDFQVLAIASGQWSAFFAASVMDGHAIACDHWTGEISE